MNEIRPAVEHDDADVQRLLCQLNPDAPSTRWNWNAVRQGSRTFVAAVDGRTVGVALASYIDYGPSNYGTIEELVVDESFRGQGVGRDLLAACCRWLDEQNLQVIFTSTSPERQAFYQRSGFEPCTGPWLYRSPSEDGHG